MKIIYPLSAPFTSAKIPPRGIPKCPFCPRSRGAADDQSETDDHSDDHRSDDHSDLTGRHTEQRVSDLDRYTYGNVTQGQRTEWSGPVAHHDHLTIRHHPRNPRSTAIPGYRGNPHPWDQLGKCPDTYCSRIHIALGGVPRARNRYPHGCPVMPANGLPIHHQGMYQLPGDCGPDLDNDIGQSCVFLVSYHVCA
jgi:hypothetical protein